MSERTYYVLCEDNCRFESMTKEQILSAITQAVESHEISDVDTGFVTTLKEQNHNTALKFWLGTTAEYNAISVKEANCFYILTDDSTRSGFESDIDRLENSINALDAGIDSRMDAYEASVDTRFDTLEDGIDTRLDAFEDRIDEEIDDFEDTIEARVPEKNKLLKTFSPYANSGEDYTVNGINNYSVIAFVLDVVVYNSQTEIVTSLIPDLNVIACIGAGSNFAVPFVSKVTVSGITSTWENSMRFTVSQNKINFSDLGNQSVSNGEVRVRIRKIYGVY